jgi:hypothetical protein
MEIQAKSGTSTDHIEGQRHVCREKSTHRLFCLQLAIVKRMYPPHRIHGSNLNRVARAIGQLAKLVYLLTGNASHVHSAQVEARTRAEIQA